MKYVEKKHSPHKTWWGRTKDTFERWLSGPNGGHPLGPDTSSLEGGPMRMLLNAVLFAAIAYAIYVGAKPLFSDSELQNILTKPSPSITLNQHGDVVEAFPIFSIPSNQLVTLSPIQRLQFINPITFLVKVGFCLLGMIAVLLDVHQRFKESYTRKHSTI